LSTYTPVTVADASENTLVQVLVSGRISSISGGRGIPVILIWDGDLRLVSIAVFFDKETASLPILSDDEFGCGRLE